MKRQLSTVFVLTAVLGAIAPSADAIEFTFTTLQERQDEIVYQDNAIENFRVLQRSNL